MKKVNVILLAAVALMGLTMCTSKNGEMVYDADNDSVSATLTLPEFPGGNEAFIKFINETIKYPEEAEAAGVEGKVLVSFIVEPDGTVSTVEVKDPVNPLLDAEAIRVVKAMPNWTPGKNKEGEIVRVRMTAPLNFRLE